MSKNRTTTIKNTLNDRKPNANTESPIDSSSEDDNIEAPLIDTSKIKKPPTDKQIASITNARKIRMMKVAEKKQRKIDQNKLISIVYEKQIEEQIKKRLFLDMRKSLRKNIDSPQRGEIKSINAKI